MSYIAKQARRVPSASTQSADLALIMTWTVAGLVLTAAMAIWATPAALLMITG